MKKNFNKTPKHRSTSQSSKSNSNEKFIVKCDQKAAIISEKLLSFYEENEFFDITLVAGTGNDCVSIQAHRVILCAMSEYFLEVFRSGQSISKDNVLKLNEIKASTLKPVIDFMYSGSIEFSLESAVEILRASSFLKIKTLVDGCCELFEENINSNNCLSWFQLSNELNILKLKAKALECTYNHFEKISKEKEVLMLSENELKNLLFKDNPHGDFEEDVFLSMVAWINYDKLNREHLTLQLLSMIRYQALSPKFIVENRKLVCKTVESYELICSWLEWHLSPQSRLEDSQICAFKPRSMTDKLAAISFIESKIIITTFDPELNSWSKKIEINLPIVKPYSSSIKIDQKLLIVGGMVNGRESKSVECLDLQTLEWTVLPAMNKSRGESQLAELKGNLCVFGGDSSNGHKDNKDLDIYDFSTCKWRNVKLMSGASTSSQIAAHDGLLYILDFNYGLLQIYNMSSNKWTSRAVEQKSLEAFRLVATESFLYVIGGYYYEQGFNEYFARFNLSNGSWCDLALLPQENTWVGHTILKNKIIIISYNNFVLEYNIDTNIWEDLYYYVNLGERSILCTLKSS